LWIFFKAESFGISLDMFHQVTYGLDFSILPAFWEAYQATILIIIGAFILHALPMKWNDIVISISTKLHWTVKMLGMTAALALMYYFNTAGQVLPIYLQF
jgi:hypothetical protein